MRLRSPRVIAAYLLPAGIVKPGIRPRHVIAGMKLPQPADRNRAGARIMRFESIGMGANFRQGHAEQQ
jgi:hypothetical protein